MQFHLKFPKAISLIVVTVKCIGLLGSLKLPDSLSKLLVITKSSLVIKELKNTKANKSQSSWFMVIQVGA